MNLQKLRYLDSHLAALAHYFAKEQLFVVGGAVRDLLIGANDQPHDIDLTMAGEPDDIYKNLQKADPEAFALFRTEKFGTMTLINRTDESSYEITPFREEGGYEDHRHPEEIHRSHSLLADAKRRDFTINCLYYTTHSFSADKKKSTKVGSIAADTAEDTEKMMATLTKNGWLWEKSHSLLVLQSHELIDSFFAEGKFQEKQFNAWAESQSLVIEGTVGFLIDPFGGMEDLIAKTLRAVGDPEKRFHEDALRILRGARLVNILNQKISEGNFDFEKETWSAMKKLSGLVPSLAKERLHQEIVKVFQGTNPFGWIALIDDFDLVKNLFPALWRNRYDNQPVRYHPFDTYTHILLTLWHLQQINTDYLVKLAMLYHDVGKKDQYAAYAVATTKEEFQEIHNGPANHVVCGPVYAEEDFRALGFSNKEIEEIQFYVAYHMRPGQILMARPDNQIKRVRQLLSEYGYERVKNLLDITVADRRGQYNPLQSKEIDSVQNLYDILEKLQREEGQFTMHQLAINGDIIMKEFNLSPGPQIKEMLQQAFDRVLSDIQQRNNQPTIITHLRSIDFD